MNTIWIVLPILLILMFQLGIEIDLGAFRRIIRQPKALLVGLCGQLFLLPAAAFGIATLFNLPPVYFMGVMLIACCPGGSSSNVFTLLAKGDIALSVYLTALSSVITLFTIPPVMEFAARAATFRADAAISLPVGKLFLQNIVLVFLPMAAGILFRRVRPHAARKVFDALKRVAFPALMLLATVFFLQYTGEILDNFGQLGLVTALLLVACMAGGGLLARLFGLKAATRRTIVIEIGMQNAAQAIAIASSPLVFNNAEMALPAIVYALLMNVVLLTYLRLLRPAATAP